MPFCTVGGSILVKFRNLAGSEIEIIITVELESFFLTLFVTDLHIYGSKSSFPRITLDGKGSFHQFLAAMRNRDILVRHPRIRTSD